MKAMKPAVPVLLAALALASALAAPAEARLSYHGIETAINDDMSARTKVKLNFPEPVSRLEYTTTFPISSFRTSGNFGPVVCNSTERGAGSLISCTLSGIAAEKDTLYIEFESAGAANYSYGRYHFTAGFASSEPSERWSSIVRLPESATLPEFPVNRSYSPADGDTITDGRIIMVIWDGENATAGQRLDFSVDYNLPPIRGSVARYILIGAGIIIAAVIVAAIIYVRRASRANKSRVIASVLSADEKRVADILASGGGSALQKQVVRESGFSKAKVSRLVKSLQARGVIRVEPVSGRENRVLLAGEKKDSPAGAGNKPEERDSSGVSDGKEDGKEKTQ